MSAVRVTERWEAPRAGGDTRRRRWGIALVVLGLLGVLWGVAHVLDAAGAPARRDFAHRQTYDEVKPRVQGALLGGLLRGFAGVGLAIVGARLLRRGD